VGYPLVTCTCLYIFPTWGKCTIINSSKEQLFVFIERWGAYMKSIEFDGLPAGVTILVNGILVIGTGRSEKQEKESA
jgi:hypothetical protein